MKVILTKDVKGIGRTYEVAEVKDGHALNCLIPKKLAIAATPTAVKEAELRHKQSLEREKLDVALLLQNIASLAEERIIIKVKANEKGHLYNTVGESDIVRAVKEQARIDLPEDAVKLERPIKELGTFDIPVATAGTFGKFSVTVEVE